MSFMMCMFQLQEEELGKEYDDNKDKSFNDMINLLNKINKRNY